MTVRRPFADDTYRGDGPRAWTVAARYRAHRAWIALRNAYWRAVLDLKAPWRRLPPRLHVGSGNRPLRGWINLDAQPGEGVDCLRDVTRGIPVQDLEIIYAEHFLEHLAIDAALWFLCEAHRALRPGGVMRLTTPNLDWVMATHYPHGTIVDAMGINRAFHGWGHRFLWNRALLHEALVACGFTSIVACRYGESEREELRGLERHEPSEDAAGHAHVLVVEAVKGEPRPEALRALRDAIVRDFLGHTSDDYSEPFWRARWWEDRPPRGG